MLKLATKEDIPAIMRMAYAFAEASPYRHMTIDGDKVTKLINHMVETGGTKNILVLAMEGDTAVGLIGALVVEPPFHVGRIANELMWWVDEEYRKSHHSKDLIEAYEYWAKYVAKCDYTQMALLETDQAEVISKLYKRRGYSAVERAFMKGN